MNLRFANRGEINDKFWYLMEEPNFFLKGEGISTSRTEIRLPAIPSLFAPFGTVELFDIPTTVSIIIRHRPSPFAGNAEVAGGFYF